MTASQTTVLIVPGIRDHVEDHWQTYLRARLSNARTVPPLETDKLSLTARLDAISRTLEGLSGPVILVAHSGGVPMLAHWAARNAFPIKGALLATPPDLETPLPEGYPTMEALETNGWLPLPKARLPFPSILAASDDDPLCPLARAAAMAHDFGSRLVNLGKVGHLNPASGFGPWPMAEAFIAELDKA